MRKQAAEAPNPIKAKDQRKAKFSLHKVAGGIRGRIIILVMLMTLIPLVFLTFFSIDSQTKNIMNSMNELNASVNNGLIERINANITQSLKILELIPPTTLCKLNFTFL
jgi:hypothetical protein